MAGSEPDRAAEKTAPIPVHDLPPDEIDLPKYIIARVLRDRIRRGVYAPGEKIPSIYEIREMTVPNVAKNTARAALDILRHEGLVRTLIGYGTIVNSPEYWRNGQSGSWPM